MSSYWENRIAQIVDKQYNNSIKVTGDLKRAYKQALRGIEAAYEELYIRMLEDGEVSPLTQYKFNRYKNLEKTIVNELQKLGQKEVKMLNDISIESFVNLTEEVSGVLNLVFEPLNMHQMAQKAFEMNWKGSNFSGRIWNNKQKLLTRLKKMVTDAIALGKSKDETVKELMKIFNVGFNDADRLVRTELMNILNQAQKDLYTGNGYTKYTLLPHIDDRTSDRCKDIDESKEYLFSKAITGSNYPPLHPRCRTIAIPVIESIEMSKADSKNRKDIINKNTENGIIKVTGRKLPFTAESDAVYDLLDNDNRIIQRRYYDLKGIPKLDIDNTDHNNPKQHPIVPHSHDWKEGKRLKWRVCSNSEIEGNDDLLKGD